MISRQSKKSEVLESEEIRDDGMMKSTENLIADGDFKPYIHISEAILFALTF